MKEINIKCDKCKQSNAKSYKYVSGREMCASGNGYERNWMFIDLCWICLFDFAKKNELSGTDILECPNNNMFVGNRPGF